MKSWNSQRKPVSVGLNIPQAISFQAQIVLQKYDFHLKMTLLYCSQVDANHALWITTLYTHCLKHSNFQNDHVVLFSGSSFKVLYLLIRKSYTKIRSKAHKHSIFLARNRYFKDFLNNYFSTQKRILKKVPKIVLLKSCQKHVLMRYLWIMFVIQW